jgi:short-subunit dehydrogenase
LQAGYIFPAKKNTVGMEKNQSVKSSDTEEKEEKEGKEENGTKERTKREKESKATEKPVAVVIGASSGIGEEIALGLLTKGYTVVNISRGLCSSERVKNITADIAQGDELERAVRTVGDEYKRLALMVYSAGCSMAAPLEYAKEADVRYLFEVNYFGALRAVRSVVPYMKRGGGKIFLIGSMASSYAIPFDCFYSSSKAALDMLVKGARTELKRYHITLTSVQPGGTSTSFTFKRKVYSDEENGEYSKQVHKAVAALANIEQGGMSAQEVAEEVVKEIMRDNPSVTLATGNKNKMYSVANRILPEKVTEYLNDKKYNQ